MAEQTIVAPRPMRFPVTVAHGGRALGLMAATAAAADHSLSTAIIVGSFGLAGVVIGPFITTSLSARRESRRVDHANEHRQELLDITDHYFAELRDRDEQIRRLEDENTRLRRRR